MGALSLSWIQPIRSETAASGSGKRSLSYKLFGIRDLSEDFVIPGDWHVMWNSKRDRKEIKMKKIKIDRPSKKVDLPGLHTVTKEVVEWTITSINPGETLVLTSSDVNFLISASGGLGVNTVTVIIPDPVGPVVYPYTLPYTITVQNSSPLVDVTNSLVIDTIGPPTHPCPPEKEDGPAGGDHECEEQN
jgi:hypothetical protein